MILVVGSAAGLSLIRLHGPAFPDNLIYRWSLSYLTPLCLGLSLALLAIRLRTPRPKLWRIARQPGMAASLSVFFATIAFGLFSLLAWVFNPSEALPLGDLEEHTLEFGMVVFGSWITLGLAQASRTEPGWIDRTGRALGGCWIILMVLSYVWTYMAP